MKKRRRTGFALLEGLFSINFLGTSRRKLYTS